MKLQDVSRGRAIKLILLKKMALVSLALTLICQGLAPFVMPVSALETSSWISESPFSSLTLEGGIWLNRDPFLPGMPTSISAQSAILMRADTGEILYGHNENAVLPMASTTKIMTALVALEQMSPDTPVKIAPEAVGVEGSSVYLTAGEMLTLEELLYALMLASANDAAEAIAIAVAGSVEHFADLMNQKAATLGLKDTHFTNPHGLDHPDHHTTAYELALITRAALSHDTLRVIMSTERKTIPHNGEEGVRLLLNHNKLLRTYEGAVGVKTGFTKKSGRCLVSAASREGLTFIAVTLNAPDDWRDHASLLDYGFALYDHAELCPIGAFEAPLWVVGGTTTYVMVKNSKQLTISLPKNRGTVYCVVEMPGFIYAPVAQGDTVGALAFYEEGSDGVLRFIGRSPLVAQYEVSAEVYERSLLEILADFFGF